MIFQKYMIGKSTITVFLDSIERSGAEAIVSSDDCELSMGGGISQALMKAAGKTMVNEARKIVSRGRRPRVGDVLVTPAGRLPARYLLHAITLDWSNRYFAKEAIVRQATRKALDLLPALGCRSIAFPALGTGAAGIPPDIAASEMAAVVATTLLDLDESYEVELYLLDNRSSSNRPGFFTYFEGHLLKTLGLAATDSAAGRELTVAGAGVSGTGPDVESQRKRVMGIYHTLRLLDARRDEIEARLVAHTAGATKLSTEVFSDLQQKLAKIGEMRHGCEVDLQLRPTSSAPNPERVFLSSTFEDLKVYRQKAREKVVELGFKFIGMEEFPSWPQKPAEFIQWMVQNSEVYLGILGMRYGFVDPSTGLSMTELEYRKALAHSKPVHMFLIDNDAPITPAMVERDAAAYEKLVKMKAEVTNNYVCSFFKNETDLAHKIELTLKALHKT